MHFPTERAETLAGLAERLAEAGETKPALQLAAEASELAKDEKVRSFHQYEARVLTAVGEAYFAAGDRDEAWKLFRRAIQVAREPVKEGNWACYTLNGTATRLAKAGRFDDALQLAAAIEQPYSRASAYREIAHLCVAAGRFEQALEAGREVREPAARVVLLAAISKRYPARGAEPSHRACGLLEELAR
jgi:tetratricopeptide (TPR) repeat protein